MGGGDGQASYLPPPLPSLPPDPHLSLGLLSLSLPLPPFEAFLAPDDNRLQIDRWGAAAEEKKQTCYLRLVVTFGGEKNPPAGREKRERKCPGLVETTPPPPGLFFF